MRSGRYRRARTASWCRITAAANWISRPRRSPPCPRSWRVAGRVPVLMDGGVRRVDVLKALALGAAAVMVGRAAAWGLAAEGEAGVAGVLGILATSSTPRWC